jgi:hypothetical protein
LPSTPGVGISMVVSMNRVLALTEVIENFRTIGLPVNVAHVLSREDLQTASVSMAESNSSSVQGRHIILRRRRPCVPSFWCPGEVSG